MPDTDDDTLTEPPSSHSPMRGRLSYVVAAVAIGVLIAVVAVSVGSRDDAESADPGRTDDAVDIAADGSTGGTADGSTSTTEIPEVDTDGPFDVVLEPGPGGLLHLEVADPATPALDGAMQHCVLVTLDGPTSVEAYGCTDATAPGELVLSEPGSPRVGCAAVATRNDPAVQPAAVTSASEFDVTPAGQLPPGDYDVEVAVITGVGDGCPPADEGLERETVARTTISVG